MMTNRQLQVAIANTIVEMLWIKGFLSYLEAEKIKKRNELSF